MNDLELKSLEKQNDLCIQEQETEINRILQALAALTCTKIPLIVIPNGETPRVSAALALINRT